MNFLNFPKSVALFFNFSFNFVYLKAILCHPLQILQVYLLLLKDPSLGRLSSEVEKNIIDDDDYDDDDEDLKNCFSI